MIVSWRTPAFNSSVLSVNPGWRTMSTEIKLFAGRTQAIIPYTAGLDLLQFSRCLFQVLLRMHLEFLTLIFKDTEDNMYTSMLTIYILYLRTLNDMYTVTWILDLRLQAWNILLLFELHIAGRCLDPDNLTESESKEKIWDFSIALSIFIIQS